MIDAIHELIELDAYLEGLEDINNDGGPNTAMKVRQVLAEVLPKLCQKPSEERAAKAVSYLSQFGGNIPDDYTFAEMCGDVIIARGLDGHKLRCGETG